MVCLYPWATALKLGLGTVPAFPGSDTLCSMSRPWRQDGGPWSPQRVSPSMEPPSCEGAGVGRLRAQYSWPAEPEVAPLLPYKLGLGGRGQPSALGHSHPERSFCRTELGEIIDAAGMEPEPLAGGGEALFSWLHLSRIVLL